jgi:mannose-6-phosphate isomerase-like protein (cupin superfamily)
MGQLLPRKAHDNRPPDARVRLNTTRFGRNALDTKLVNEEISFSEEKMKKNSLFDSPHLFYDAYCLLPGQAQKVHAHEGSDKVYYVLRGTGRFTVGGEEEDLGEGRAVIARASVPHGVRNETGENLVLLVTMAPRPSP